MISPVRLKSNVYRPSSLNDNQTDRGQNWLYPIVCLSSATIETQDGDIGKHLKSNSSRSQIKSIPPRYWSIDRSHIQQWFRLVDRWVDRARSIGCFIVESNICPKYWSEILKEMSHARMFAIHLFRNSPSPTKKQQWLQLSTREWLAPWSSRRTPANNQSSTLPSALRACQYFACFC